MQWDLMQEEDWIILHEAMLTLILLRRSPSWDDLVMLDVDRVEGPRRDELLRVDRVDCPARVARLPPAADPTRLELTHLHLE